MDSVVTHNPGQSSEIAGLRSTVTSLTLAVEQLQKQRVELLRRRRRWLVVLGASVSVFCHLLLLVYLGLMQRSAGAGGLQQGMTVEFALVDQEKLTDPEPVEFDELQPEAPLSEADVPAATVELSAASPAIDMTVASSGSIAPLGASGSGEVVGLGGGGAGTSFFGISSRGTRFAYIVDISGSMGQGGRMDVAMRELTRSIQSLPDYSYVHLLLFESVTHEPPAQKGWVRARRETISQLERWLRQVEPTGGTQPRAAFMQVFALTDRPDVIFFLTDGEFDDITPEEIASLNGRSKKAVINAIAFGEPIPAAQDKLRQIARQSGGVYRFVPSGGMR